MPCGRDGQKGSNRNSVYMHMSTKQYLPVNFYSTIYLFVPECILFPSFLYFLFAVAVVICPAFYASRQKGGLFGSFQLNGWRCWWSRQVRRDRIALCQGSLTNWSLVVSWEKKGLAASLRLIVSRPAVNWTLFEELFWCSLQGIAVR